MYGISKSTRPGNRVFSAGSHSRVSLSMFLIAIVTLMILVSGLSSTAFSAPRKKSGKKVKAVEPQPDTPDTTYEGIFRTYQIGTAAERKKAISEMRKLMKKNPQDGLPQYYLGIMQFEEGRYKQAEDHFKTALMFFPESDDIMFRLGKTLLERKNVDEARENFNKVIAQNPKHGGALGMLGIFKLMEEDFDGAIELLTRAKELVPDDHSVLRGLGEAYFKKDRITEAMDVLGVVLALDNNDPEAHWWMGKCQERAGNHTAAAESFQTAKKLGKRDDSIKELVGYDLARSLFDTGQAEEALKQYKKVVKELPDPETGWYEMAKIHEYLGDNDKAIKAYEEAYNLNTKMTDAIFDMAELYQTMGEPDKAVESLQLIAKKRDESGDRAKALIEDLKQEMFEEVREQLLEVAATGTEEERENAYYKMLGMEVTDKITHYRPGLKLTIVRFNKFGEMDPNDRDALEGLRDLAMERGDLDEATRYIKWLKKAKHITKAEADIQLNELSYRFEAGEDLAKWENRLEEYKHKGEWDKALRENQKLKAYAQSQLEYWKKYHDDPDLRAEMIKATKARLQTIAETAKDIKAAKKRSK